MGKLASFIIPVYNGEKYIDSCVENILSQTQPRDTFEAIFVNDGSSDGSLKILRGYEAKYPKLIKVIDQNNRGAGEARNKAISVAKAKYIIPIDCDDIVQNNYAQTLITAIQKTKAEYVISGYNTVDEKFRLLSTVLPADTYFTRFRVTLTVGKIYDRLFLKSNRITYTHAFIMEDPHFNIMCAMKASTVGVIRYAGYDVVMKSKVKGQLTSSTMVRNNNPHILNMLKGFVNENDSFSKSQPTIFKYILAKFAYNNFLANKLEYKDAYKGLAEQLRYIETNGYMVSVREVLFGLQGELLGTKFVILLMKFLTKIKLLKPFYFVYLKIVN